MTVHFWEYSKFRSFIGLKGVVPPSFSLFRPSHFRFSLHSTSIISQDLSLLFLFLQYFSSLLSINHITKWFLNIINLNKHHSNRILDRIPPGMISNQYPLPQFIVILIIVSIHIFPLDEGRSFDWERGIYTRNDLLLYSPLSFSCLYLPTVLTLIFLLSLQSFLHWFILESPFNITKTRLNCTAWSHSYLSVLLFSLFQYLSSISSYLYTSDHSDSSRVPLSPLFPSVSSSLLSSSLRHIQYNQSLYIDVIGRSSSSYFIQSIPLSLSYSTSFLYS